MRPTVKDVARRAGVSPKTVSNVVNGTFAVRPETRAKVTAAMAELGYVPNFAARGLRTGRTGVIAVALPDLGTNYSAELIHHLVAAATSKGLVVQVEESGGRAERELALISQARAHQIDGLILNPTRLETSAVQPGTDLPPLVLIGEVDSPLADHVWIDNRAAVRELTQSLQQQGRRRIAALGCLDSASSHLRLAGYRDAVPLVDRIELSVTGWSAAAGAVAADAALDLPAPPDAFLCFTDTLALGALNTLWRRGIQVPSRVAVAGFDDIAPAAYAIPPLTTVAVDKAAVAAAALDLLLARIADPGAAVTSRTVAHQIIRRASS